MAERQGFNSQTDQFDRSSVNNLHLNTHRLNIEAFERLVQRVRISQRALINRQDGNQVRPASRSIGGSPETFRSSFAADGDSSSRDECTPVCMCICMCALSGCSGLCAATGLPTALPDTFVFRDRETFL